MKPIVIYVDKQKNNITLTREEFEDLLTRHMSKDILVDMQMGKRIALGGHMVVVELFILMHQILQAHLPS